MIKQELEMAVGKDEEILWRGVPDKKCFILERIIPIAFIIIVITLLLATFVFASLVAEQMYILIISVFFWGLILIFYLIPFIATFKEYNNTGYIVTDRAIYISSGWLSYAITTKPFAEISHINIHRGILDQFFNDGDVILTSSKEILLNDFSQITGTAICDIKDYQEVYQLVKKLHTDIYSDTMYPNDLRPKENHGYKTKYINPE